ncbi:MAG: DUF6580 family putative transport protein [Lacibacter sp.]|jgi:hypothetical protein
MKLNKQIIWILIAMIVVASLYRIVPNRPYGFAPQIAMALFSGSVIRNRKFAFAVPLVSMLLGDLAFQALYTAGLVPYGGFYKGQITNYLLFAGLTVLGFFIQHNKTWQVALGSLAGPTLYFFISNSLVWISGGGYHHPKTFSGWMLTLVDGIPFYTGSLYATVVFATLFFGGYQLLQSNRQAVATSSK